MSVDKDVLAHAKNTNYRTLVDDGSIGNILDKSTRHNVFWFIVKFCQIVDYVKMKFQSTL